MIAYKLTDQDGYTRKGQDGETHWEIGATVHPVGKGTRPCGPGVLHAYISPEVAVLANPIHARLSQPRCFEVEVVEGGWETDGLKRWTTSPLKVLREIDLPEIDLKTRVAWAIVLAPHEMTRKWAVRWLRGDSEAGAAAGAAAAAARAAAGETTYAAARAAARAAAEAAEAAYAAAAYAAAAAYVGATAAAAYAAAWAAAEKRLHPALDRARAILAGEYPAADYDKPLD